MCPSSPSPELSVHDDPSAAAEQAADLLADALREAVHARGHGSLAVSGGRAGPLFEALGSRSVPWDHVDVFQVDERVAPEGHEDRNLGLLRSHLPEAALGRVRPMPVTDPDLEAAAAAYAAAMPVRLDAVHLGLGGDGHTASLVPNDPVLHVDDRDVAVSAPYEGRRRMTLTFPALARARVVVWLVTGADKAGALRRLVEGDTAIPAVHVAAPRQVIVVDRPAAGR